jgi:hypothetical protein
MIDEEIDTPDDPLCAEAQAIVANAHSVREMQWALEIHAQTCPCGG